VPGKISHALRFKRRATIVGITTSTICGTDLHILKGDVPSVTDGRILGHEGIGVVEEVGSGVSSVRRGDRVLISCITSCGTCDFLQERDVLALPVRRLDSRQHYRRDPGRVCAHSARGHEPVRPPSEW
jgi:threonine dehydrogenase-like Zn-dependent dehydrogenase